jgi:hypothetical protein
MRVKWTLMQMIMLVRLALESLETSSTQGDWKNTGRAVTDHSRRPIPVGIGGKLQ